MLVCFVLALILTRLALADRNVTLSVDDLTLTPQRAWTTDNDVRSLSDGGEPRMAYTLEDGAAASFKFTGTAVYVRSWKATNQGVMLLSVDSGTPKRVDCFESTFRPPDLPINVEIIDGISGLANTEHLVTYVRQSSDRRANLGDTGTLVTSTGLVYQFVFTVPDTPSPVSSSAPAGTSSTAAAPKSSSSNGAIIGGAAAGGALLLALLVFIGVYVYRRRKRQADQRASLAVFEGEWQDPTYKASPGVHMSALSADASLTYRSAPTSPTSPRSQDSLLTPTPYRHPSMATDDTSIQQAASSSGRRESTVDAPSPTSQADLEARLRALEQSMAGGTTPAPPLYSPSLHAEAPADRQKWA